MVLKVVWVGMAAIAGSVGGRRRVGGLYGLLGCGSVVRSFDFSMV